MSADQDPEVRIIEISEERLMTVLHSEEELDGVTFEQDADGSLVVYSDVWTLQLFLFALAWTMGPDVEPQLEGHRQTYHTLAQLTMAQMPSRPAPEYGEEAIGCKLPALRLIPAGESKP